MSAIKKARWTIDSPAAKQMLYYHYSTWYSSNSFWPGTKYSYAEDCELHHDFFYNQFEGLGDLRIPEIAISNGTIIEGDINVIGQTFLPNDIILSANEDIGMQDCWLKDDCVTFQADLILRALPDGAGEIYDGTININVLGMGTERNMYRYIYDALPYDSSPGGSRPFENDSEGGTGLTVDWEKDAHCFVPTISSLGLDDINSNMHPYYTNDLENPNNVLPYCFYVDYTGSTESEYRYGNSDSPSYNEQHIYFSTKTAGFFLSYLLAQNPLLASGLNTLTNRTYNFGTPEVQASTLPYIMDNTIDFDLEVYNNGKLWFNRDDIIAFTDENNLQNMYPQDYDAVIKGANCGEDPTTVEIFDDGELKVGDHSVYNKATLEIRDNGTLVIGEDGFAEVEHGSEIIIKQDGELRIENGGFINSTYGGRVIVEDGGVLHVKNGGTFRVSHYSSLIVEDGGKLIIDGSAIIQTWDGQNPDGLAKIHIKEGGELVWNGTPTYSGNGYFEFDHGNILTIEDGFELDGEGQGYKMIQLNQNAILNTDDNDLNLTNGKIVYSYNSAIINENSAINATNVDFVTISDNDAIAISASETWNTNFQHCTFTGFSDDIAVEIYGDNLSDNYTDIFDDCTFTNNGIALDFNVRRNVVVSNSSFDNNEIAISGWDCKDINTVSCQINDCFFGVYLNDVEDFTMTGGEIHFLNTGIHAKTGNNNITLLDGAQIINPSPTPPITSGYVDDFAAIAMNGSISYPPLVIFGNIYMDCSKIEAYYGIVGSDITFNIDAIDNSNGEHPNVFNCQYAFDICYNLEIQQQLGPIFDPILARGNYWKEGPTEASSPYPFGWNVYSFRDISYNSSCGNPTYNNHNLFYTPVATEFPEDCFIPQDRQDITTTSDIIDKKTEVSIYPNPTTNYFTIKTHGSNIYQFTLMNIYGQKVIVKTVENGMEININNLESGLYIYKFVDDNNKSISGKLVIQK